MASKTGTASMDCLFNDVSVCAGRSSEHLIQHCLGGTLARSDVACDTCNKAFGREVDPGLGAFYMHLIDTLRPFMPAAFRSIERRVRAVGSDVMITLRPGGIAELGKIYRERDENGVLKTLSAPASTDRRVLEAIARKCAPDKTFKFTAAPLSRVNESGMTEHNLQFSYREHRAAVKSIIEIFDWATRKMCFPAYARSPLLRHVRDYVRNGRFGPFIGRSTSPMYPLEEEMDDLFSPRRHTFSNRVLVVNDAGANRVFGLLQVANTMPLGACLGTAVGSSDFTLSYEAGLFANDCDHCEIRDGTPLSWRTFYDSRFIIKSGVTNDFAFHKLHDSLGRQLGRAVIYTDMNHDDGLLEVFRQHIWHRAISDMEVNASCVREIFECLLRLRFGHNLIREAEWNVILNSLDVAPVDVGGLVSTVRATGTLGAYGPQLLALFRGALQRIVEQHGAPRVAVLFPDTPRAQSKHQRQRKERLRGA